MSRKTSGSTPTDEIIQSYDNVPVEIAAKYIGWSSCNVARALQQERAPYGHAAQTGVSEETGQPTYSYNISPGQLVAYKRGKLECWRLSALAKVVKTEIADVLNDQLREIVDARILAVFASVAARRRTHHETTCSKQNPIR